MSDQTDPAQDGQNASGAEADERALPRNRGEWSAMMERLTEEEGYFEPLGQRHFAFFHDDGPRLLVSFERLEDILSRPDRLPMAMDLARARGWSLLCLVSEGETWFRDKRVYGYVDRLVDEAFFDDFDQVIFLGLGTEGYAAAAFSVAAPGARVLAITPRATQDPEVAVWDRRSLKARALDFTSRFGYAPDMIEGAGRVHVIYDPGHSEDAMHASLFRGPHVRHLRCPHLRGRVAWALGQLQLWGPLIDAVAEDRLDRAEFGRIWRVRRNFGPYLRGLLGMLREKGATQREKWLCRGVISRLNAPTFRRRLTEILAEEAEAEASRALAADLPPAPATTQANGV
ncbi:MAG: hypothetical protein MUF74_00710 [Cypionkella sp.]|nr:hypothetical protein [Cypionkella sp.]